MLKSASIDPDVPDIASLSDKMLPGPMGMVAPMGAYMAANYMARSKNPWVKGLGVAGSMGIGTFEGLSQLRHGSDALSSGSYLQAAGHGLAALGNMGMAGNPLMGDGARSWVKKRLGNTAARTVGAVTGTGPGFGHWALSNGNAPMIGTAAATATADYASQRHDRKMLRPSAADRDPPLDLDALGEGAVRR
jgi:hypothetical protein